MNITVCFKIMPDLSMLSDADGAFEGSSLPDLSFTRHGFTCFDETSLEMALKLKDRLAGFQEKAELTALTIDDQKADHFLKHLYALRYDHSVRIQPEKFTDLVFHPLGISGILSACIKHTGRPDLVICGIQGGEGGSGQTGFLVAERLGWPCIRDVMDVGVNDPSGGLTVTSRTDGGIMTQTIDLPAVLVTGNSPFSPYLRVPTLKQKLNAAAKKIMVPGLEDLGLKELGPKKLGMQDTDMEREDLIKPDKDLKSLSRPKSPRPFTLIQGKTAEDNARILYEHYLKDRLNL